MIREKVNILGMVHNFMLIKIARIMHFEKGNDEKKTPYTYFAQLFVGNEREIVRVRCLTCCCDLVQTVL